MLDVVFHSPVLGNVILAVTKPGKTLMLTGFVGLVIMFQFGLVAFYIFRPDFHGSCSSALGCIVTVVYEGMQGVLMEFMSFNVPSKDGYVARVAFDLSFYTVITTVLMNVIFGIIIDTFGELRDKQAEREEHLRTKAFVSCLDRQEVDREAQLRGIRNGFDVLEEQRQNRWDYMYFIFYVKEKDATEYSGPETRIAEALKKKDISWLPIGRALIMTSPLGEEIPDVEVEAAGGPEEEEDENRKDIVALKAKVNTISQQLSMIQDLLTEHQEPPRQRPTLMPSSSGLHY